MSSKPGRVLTYVGLARKRLSRISSKNKIKQDKFLR